MSLSDDVLVDPCPNFDCPENFDGFWTEASPDSTKTTEVHCLACGQRWSP